MKDRLTKVLCLLVIISFILFSPLDAKEDPKKIDLKGLDQFITDVMEEWKVPGLAISIVKDGQLIYSKGLGFRDVDRELKVTPKTLFAIGSCSKAITAVTMGMLVGEGKLDWNEPVREYLPSFKLKDSFSTERMTPRDLVCHRSGLPRHDYMWYNSSYTRKELFERLQYLEPSKDFRTTWQYQNLMFMTAGYLVGKIAGTTWEDFVKKRIFEPLGMKESNFSVEDSKKAADFAFPYTKKEDKVIEIPFRNIDNVGPAGSINSNVTEMTNWLLLNLNNGKFDGKQIITENSLREVHSPQMLISKTIEQKELFYGLYGMGWGITSYRGNLLLSHGGGIDGFTARVSLMPHDNFGLVILSNLSGTPVPQIVAFNVYDRLLGLDFVPWNKRIKEEVEKAKKEAEKAKKESDRDRKLNTKPSHSIEDYTGDYSHPGYGIIKIEMEGGQPKALFNSIEYSMNHYHYDIFEAKNEFLDVFTKISFFTDEKGNIGSLSVLLEPNVDPIVFNRMPEKKMMERGFLEKFTGEYNLMDKTLTVFLKGEDTLFLSIPGQPEYELVPYKGTEFNLKNFSGYSVEFIMDESGNVVEVKIKQPEGIFTAKKKE